MSLQFEISASVDEDVYPGDAVYYAKVIMSSKYQRQKRVYIARTASAVQKKLRSLEKTNSLKRHARVVKIFQLRRLPNGQIPEWRLPVTHAIVYVAIPNAEIARDGRFDRPKASHSAQASTDPHTLKPESVDYRAVALQVISGGRYTISELSMYKTNGWITEEEFEEARKQLELN